MKIVFKYPLKLTAKQTIRMPEGAIILSVQEQNGSICIWALVNKDAPEIERHIVIVGTGYEDVAPDMTHLATVQLEGGRFVFHVFETLAQENLAPAPVEHKPDDLSQPDLSKDFKTHQWTARIYSKNKRAATRMFRSWDAARKFERTQLPDDHYATVIRSMPEDKESDVLVLRHGSVA